jgi:hypothetical protein
LSGRSLAAPAPLVRVRSQLPSLLPQSISEQTPILTSNKRKLRLKQLGEICLRLTREKNAAFYWLAGA